MEKGRRIGSAATSSHPRGEKGRTRSRSVEVSNDVGHTSLVTHGSRKVNGLLGVVLGEGLDLEGGKGRRGSVLERQTPARRQVSKIAAPFLVHERIASWGGNRGIRVEGLRTSCEARRSKEGGISFLLGGKVGLKGTGQTTAPPLADHSDTSSEKPQDQGSRE